MLPRVPVALALTTGAVVSGGVQALPTLMAANAFQTAASSAPLAPYSSRAEVMEPLRAAR